MSKWSIARRVIWRDEVSPVKNSWEFHHVPSSHAGFSMRVSKRTLLPRQTALLIREAYHDRYWTEEGYTLQEAILERHLQISSQVKEPWDSTGLIDETKWNICESYLLRADANRQWKYPSKESHTCIMHTHRQLIRHSAFVSYLHFMKTHTWGKVNIGWSTGQETPTLLICVRGRAWKTQMQATPSGYATWPRTLNDLL